MMQFTHSARTRMSTIINAEPSVHVRGRSVYTGRASLRVPPLTLTLVNSDVSNLCAALDLKWIAHGLHFRWNSCRGMTVQARSRRDGRREVEESHKPLRW